MAIGAFLRRARPVRRMYDSSRLSAAPILTPESGGWEARSKRERSPTVPTSRRRKLALVAAAVAALAAAPSAHAGPLVSSADGCADQSLGKPFLPWLDLASYHIAPGGTFESGTDGWTLDGASLRDGNEPWQVHGSGETSSLAIAAGGSATTPATCVGVEHPTIRLFAKRTSGWSTGRLSVEVLFEDASGTVRSAGIGQVGSDGTWSPTAPLPILVNLLPVLPGERTAVAFRFTASSSSSWAIDDVYVDPYCRC
jgi:hypothetical protein